MDNRSDDHRNGGNGPSEAGRDAFERASALGEERLSAYLDGECTAAEQADLEARMAANAEFRQLVEELRSVRSSLDLLPRHRLETNFAEHVLRRAEREVLTGTTSVRAPTTAGAAVDRSLAKPMSGVSPVRQGAHRSARPFLWTIAALAAAVLILIVNREPEIRRDPIARGPEVTLQREPQLRAATPGERDNNLTQDEKSAETAAASKSTLEDKERLDSLAAQSGDRESRRSGELAGADGPRPEPRAAATGPASQDKPARAEDLRERLSAGTPIVEERGLGASVADQIARPQNAPGDKQGGTTAEKLADDRAARSATDSVRLQMAPASLGIRGGKDLRSSPAPSATPLDDASASGPAATASGAEAVLGQQSQQRGGSQRQSTADNGAVANKEATDTFTPRRDSFRVVEVVVTRDAWQQGAVEDLFAKNEIAVFDRNVDRPSAENISETNQQSASRLSSADASANDESDKADAADDVKKKNLERAGQAGARSLESKVVRSRSVVRQTQAPTDQAAKAPAQAPANAPAVASEAPPPSATGAAVPARKPAGQDVLKRVEVAQQPAPSDGLELLIVSATTAQIDSALDDLNKQEQFRVVQVTDASSPDRLFEEARFGSVATRYAGGFGATRDQAPTLGARIDQLKVNGRGDAPVVNSPAAERPQSTAGAAGRLFKDAVDASETDPAGTSASTKQKVTPKAQSYNIGSPHEPATDSRHDERETLSAAPTGGSSRDKASTVPPLDKKLAMEKRDGAGQGTFGSGLGGGGYGPGAAPESSVRSLPRGYAERVRLQAQEAAELPLASSREEQLRAKRELASTDQTETAQADSLAPERVLFFFRIVDEPLAKARTERASGGSVAGERAKADAQDSAKSGSREATPVPAPTAPSAK